MDNKNKIVILALAGAGIGIAAYKAMHPFTVPPLETPPDTEVVDYTCPTCGYSFTGYLETEDVFCPQCADNGIETVMTPLAGEISSIAATISECSTSVGGKTQIIVYKRFGIPYAYDVYLSNALLQTLLYTGALVGSIAIGTLIMGLTGGSALLPAIAASILTPQMAGAAILAVITGAFFTPSLVERRAPYGAIFRFIVPCIPIKIMAQPAPCLWIGSVGNLTMEVYGYDISSKRVPLRAIALLTNGQCGAGVGTFSITSIPVGWYNITVLGPVGYAVDRFSIQIFEGQQTQLVILSSRFPAYGGGGRAIPPMIT